MVLVSNSSETGILNFTLDIYEGDYVTGSPPLPTSQAYVDGNSIVYDEAYNKAVKADVNEHIYDKTDPSNVVSKVIPLSTVQAYSGEYFFVGTEGSAIYDSTQTEPDLTKIKDKLGI